MRGSLTTSLMGAFGFIAIAWGNTTVVAVPASQPTAGVTTEAGINRPPLRAGSQGMAVSELQGALKLLGYYTGAVDGVYTQSTASSVSRFQQAAGLNPDGVVNQGTWERLFPLTSPIESSPSASTNSAAAFPVPSATRTAVAVPERSTSNTSSITKSKPVVASASSSSASPSNASSTKTPSTSVDLPVLRVGMRGPAVTKLQERLQVVGLFKGGIDGVFGPGTETAVKAAQQRYRIKADGVVGSATWSALLR